MELSKRQKYNFTFRNLAILSFLFVILTKATQAQLDEETREKIDSFIKNVFLPMNNDPATVIAINVNGSLAYATGYGMMDVERQLPATNETFYPIGSVSKSFAGVVAAKILHEKFPELGNSVLDTPIVKLVPPGFNFTLNDRYLTEQVSFRDILSHRVCSQPINIATRMIPFTTTEEIGYRQRYAREVRKFRSDHVYNNGMYILMSEVLAAIAGRSYESLIFELLNDLEMWNSTIIRDSDPDIIPGRAVPYYWRDDDKHVYNPGLIRRVSVATISGGIVSNPVEMSKYIQFHLNKGKVGNRQVVPEEVMNSLYEIAIHLPINEDSFKQSINEINLGYGMGLNQYINDGFQQIGHGGQVPPFLCFITFYPALNMGMFIATNQAPLNNKMYYPQLYTALFRILRGEDVDETEWIKLASQNNLKAKPKVKSRAIPFSSKRLTQKMQNEFLGSYGNGLEGEMDIIIKFRNETNSTELYMNYGLWGQAYLLETENELEFQLSWDSDAIHDKYADDADVNGTFIVFNEDKTALEVIDQGRSDGIFRKGENLDILPPIPYDPESCGPEN